MEEKASHGKFAASARTSPARPSSTTPSRKRSSTSKAAKSGKQPHTHTHVRAVGLSYLLPSGASLSAQVSQSTPVERKVKSKAANRGSAPTSATKTKGSRAIGKGATASVMKSDPVRKYVVVEEPDIRATVSCDVSPFTTATAAPAGAPSTAHQQLLSADNPSLDQHITKVSWLCRDSHDSKMIVPVNDGLWETLNQDNFN